MCSRIWISCSLLGVMTVAACGDSNKAPEQPKPATPAAAPVAQVEAPKPADPHEVFTTRCATCHGANGKGDGPAASSLNPKPRNYTDLTWQKSVTDDQIKKTILYGGAAVGKSPIMPANPDLESKPELLDQLVQIVRAFNAS